MIKRIDDYKKNLKLFLAQYSDSTKLKGIVAAADDSANDLETALFEIGENIYLDTAIGEQLDLLGVVWDLRRLGMSDTDYREALKAKATLVYSGEPEAIISILKVVTGASYVDYYPCYPGKYRLLLDYVTAITQQQLEKISPAGVCACILGLLIAEEPTTWYLVDAAGNALTYVVG